MRVLLNGRDAEVGAAATLADLVAVAGVGEEERGVAASLDGDVVPRTRWRDVRLHEGARIEVVRATAGG